jgi:inosose dehydratase
MIKLGYHPATWGKQDRVQAVWEAVDTIAEMGWDGFEFAGQGLSVYYDRPESCGDPLKAKGIELSTVYTGCSFADDEAIQTELGHVTEAADFCAALAVETILIDGGRNKDGPKTAGTEVDYQRVATAANRMGEIARERGRVCSWHQHWGSLFEYPDAFDRLMALTDPELVRFTPDTAQLTLGGFDLVDVFTRYLDRIHYVHFKDLDSDRRFIELGRGVVDFPPLWDILADAGYSGWIVVDLDYTSLSPAESCRINKEYLNDTLGILGERDRGAASADQA